MVQDNLAKVKSKNKFVLDEQQRITIEKEESQNLAEDAKLAEEQLKKEKQEMEEDLKSLKAYRDKWMERAGSKFNYFFIIYVAVKFWNFPM